MKRTFDVTGMTCAACSSRVEKATAGVAGVDGVAVNLLKNSMEVEYDGSDAVAAAISAAVKKAGYGAFLRPEPGQTGAAAPAARPVNDAAAEAKRVKVRLIVSFCFTIPLFYLSMGHMMGWPLPACFLGMENAMTFAFTQFLLLIPMAAYPIREIFRIGKDRRKGQRSTATELLQTSLDFAAAPLSLSVFDCFDSAPCPHR